jgi:hypothetical protein
MVEYIMKKEVCGIFHAKCGTRDLTKVFGIVPRKAGRVVTLAEKAVCTEFILLQGPVADICELGNEPSGSIKGTKFLY